MITSAFLDSLVGVDELHARCRACGWVGREHPVTVGRYGAHALAAWALAHDDALAHEHASQTTITGRWRHEPA